ncbi:MAG: hypothetical protein RJA90_348, partial [Bacteroidota bacterium]
EINLRKRLRKFMFERKKKAKYEICEVIL